MLIKKILSSILAATIFLLCGCTNSQNISNVPQAKYEFKFSILKIGQADAIILKSEKHSVIIDCGEEDDGSKIIDYLQNNNIDSVDYLFITHFDKDHVGGATEVIKNVDVKNIVTPNYEGSNDEYKNYKQAIKQKNINPILLNENMSFTIDDVLFEIYPPLKKTYKNSDNDFSLAISVTHGDNTFLFTGDAEEERLGEILSQTNKEYDFLKVAHHGRYNKKTKAFFESVKPTYAVITCSKKNPAEEETIKALENINCNIYYTKDGNVNITSDGHAIKITQ